MKISPITAAATKARTARSVGQHVFSLLLTGIISLSLSVAISRAQPSSYEADGEEVLTRGPVHEAFAAVVSYNPEPGIVVRKRPPELVEELPPEERPEGDDVAWIPGYWGWDDERNDFLWISGTWRAVPPGRDWAAGYWRENDSGYQWVSGYWANATEQETTYLPPPPATLEVGANVNAPSDDYGWSPGCWIWREDRYAWRAGYWAEGRADWIWVPAYYTWTPRGVIFVEGFWDYPVERRGMLFAPVYYRSQGYARRGYSHSPRIAINLSLFLDNLFLRPRYHHYYFGDYYGSRYEQDGFYASISFQSSRRGYDPFYSHSRWEHRSDLSWENRFRASYQDRRDHEAARPPRTWSDQMRVNSSIAAGGQVRLQMAVPLAQLARSPDNPVRFQPVAQGDRQQFARRSREVQEFRDQRRTVETRASANIGRSAGAVVEPIRVAAPRSPIVASPTRQEGRNPAPPQAQQAPRPNFQAGQPRTEAPGRPPNADRRNTPPETRQFEPQRTAPPEPRANEFGRRLAPEEQGQTLPSTDQRNRDAEARAQTEAQARQNANETAVDNKQQAAERRDATDAKARDELQRKTQESQQRVQQDSDRRTRDAEARSQADDRSRRQAGDRANASAQKDREESQQKANESAARDQQQAEQRRNAAASKARDESQRQQQQLAAQQQMTGQPDANRRNLDEQQKFQVAEQSRQQAAEQGNSARKARDESQQRANESAARDQQQAEERGNAAASKARDEAQRQQQQVAAQQQAAAQQASAQAQQNEERAKARQEAQRNTPEARGKQPDELKRAKDEFAKANPAPKPADEGDDDAKKDKEKTRK